MRDPSFLPVFVELFSVDCRQRAGPESPGLICRVPAMIVSLPVFFVFLLCPIVLSVDPSASGILIRPVPLLLLLVLFAPDFAAPFPSGTSGIVRWRVRTHLLDRGTSFLCQQSVSYSRRDSSCVIPGFLQGPALGCRSHCGPFISLRLWGYDHLTLSCISLTPADSTQTPPSHSPIALTLGPFESFTFVLVSPDKYCSALGSIFFLQPKFVRCFPQTWASLPHFKSSSTTPRPQVVSSKTPTPPPRATPQ